VVLVAVAGVLAPFATSIRHRPHRLQAQWVAAPPLSSALRVVVTGIRFLPALIVPRRSAAFSRHAVSRPPTAV